MAEQFNSPHFSCDFPPVFSSVLGESHTKMKTEKSKLSPVDGYLSDPAAPNNSSYATYRKPSESRWCLVPGVNAFGRWSQVPGSLALVAFAIVCFLCLKPSVARAQSSSCGVYVGATVRVVNTGTLGLRVRQCAGTSCTQIGNKPDGSIGTVIGGPTSANGYLWWQVQWCDQSGWSAEYVDGGCTLQAVSPLCGYPLQPPERGESHFAKLLHLVHSRQLLRRGDRLREQ